jgi:SAM-dependent methyltransferase
MRLLIINNMSKKIESITNFRAYDKVESLDNFESISEIQAYRDRRIARYQLVVNFIAKRSHGRSSDLKVVELGSGSSALLYALVEKNLLKYGLGIEYSKSRFEFAELWKSENGYTSVENINKDFVNVVFQKSAFDWFIVIDNTFTYLYPENQDYPKELLNRAFVSLKNGGRVLLDFFNYSGREPGVETQQWIAFPKTDPFSYGLYSYTIENGINTSKSIFIKRDGNEEQSKIELSKVYSIKEISNLLTECGFVIEDTFCNFNEEPFFEKLSERLVVVGMKP